MTGTGFYIPPIKMVMTWGYKHGILSFTHRSRAAIFTFQSHFPVSLSSNGAWGMAAMARRTQYGGFVVKALLNLGGDIEQEARYCEVAK